MTPLYKVTLVEKRKAHYYSVNDSEEFWPGVTTVLNVISKPFLINWAAKMTALKIKQYLTLHAVDRKLTKEEIEKLVEDGRNQHEIIRDQAGDLGSRAHFYINQIVTNTLTSIDDIDEDVKPAVDAYLKWQLENRLKLTIGDTKIASLLHQFGGSLDACAYDENGKIVIVDFKTSNKISDEYAYQVAAYAQAMKETYGLDYLPEGYILRLDKNKPIFEFRKIADIQKSLDGFLHCLWLYKDLKREQFQE